MKKNIVVTVAMSLALTAVVAQADPASDACLKTASTELFGVKLKCVNRAELRTAMRNTRAEAVREVDGSSSDVYESGDTIKVVLFYHNDLFVGAKYTYRAGPQQPQYEKLEKVMIRRHGQPLESKGSVEEAQVSRDWTTEDGLVVKLYRQPNSADINMAYFIPERRQAMMKAQRASQKR